MKFAKGCTLSQRLVLIGVSVKNANALQHKNYKETTKRRKKTIKRCRMTTERQKETQNDLKDTENVQNYHKDKDMQNNYKETWKMNTKIQKRTKKHAK